MVATAITSPILGVAFHTVLVGVETCTLVPLFKVMLYVPKTSCMDCRASPVRFLISTCEYRMRSVLSVLDTPDAETSAPPVVTLLRVNTAEVSVFDTD